jgi:hypothetical protein
MGNAAVPRLCELYPGIWLTIEKKHGNTSVRVIENCPNMPMAAAQYTFTHKQYTEYTGGNCITINKNGKCGSCPVFASYTLVFALRPRKKSTEKNSG